MRSTLSNRMLGAMHGQETDEVVLPLIKLTQADWTGSTNLVPNWEPITHQGEVYQPWAFEISLPDEEAEGIPVINWTADNVVRDLVAALRGVTGFVQAQIVWVLASTPDKIEIGPINVEMRAAQYDAVRIGGTLGVEPILETPFGHMTMNPSNAPGLF